MSARTTAMVIFVASVLAIAGAWMFQYAGYAPCELCLKQRWLWYAAILLALIGVWIAGRSRRIARYWLLLLAIIFVASAVFGIHHSGVEWGWWPGPDTCSGALAGGLPDLTNEPAVRCDEAAIRILGLSLAGWNAVISAGLAALAVYGARRG